MSIALGTNKQVESSGISIAEMSYTSGFQRPEISPVVRRVVGGGGAAPEAEKTEEMNACSSSSSSIGRNSDLSGRSSDGEDSGENEAQSSYKGPLDMMDSLEEVLPIRKGISKFYNGKSKSFTSLADASSTSSVKDIVKPDNAYTRKLRNLLAFNHVWDKNRSIPHRSNSGGISKRPISSSRSSLALAVAMSSSDSNSSEESNSRSPPPRPPRPPQSRGSNVNFVSISTPQRGFSAWRSYSLADLQDCDAAAVMKPIKQN